MKLLAAAAVVGTLVLAGYAAGPGAQQLARLAAGVAPLGLDAAPAALPPILEITKRCPNVRYLGREAVFTITVANRGGETARNVIVTDTLTGGVEFISADNNGTREGNRVVWRLPALEAGAVRSFNVVTRANQIGFVKNTASVAYCAEAVASCEMEVKGIAAVLLECVDDPDPIEVGGELTYTIIVTNQGSTPATNVTLQCTIPPEQEFIRAGGATGGRADGKIVNLAPLPSLPARAKATWTVTVKGVREGDARFYVTLRTDQLTSPVEETESTHVY